MSNTVDAVQTKNAIPEAESRKYFIRLMIPMTMISMLYSMQLSPLTLYITDLGGTAWHVGLIGGINFIVGILIRPFAGYLTDQKGRQKVYMFGAIMYVLCTIGYVVSPNVWVLILSRALIGFALCGTTTAQGAIVADLYPNKVERCFYIMGALQTVAGLFAPLFGIWLGGVIGWPMMFAVTAVGYVIALLLSGRINYEKQYKHDWITTEKTTMPHLKDLFETSALLPSVCIMLHGVAHISIMSFIAVYGTTIGISNVGLFFTINSIATVFVTMFLMKVAGEKYRNKVFYTGAVFFLLTMAAIIFAQNLSMLYIAAIFFAVAYNATQPILNTIALAKAPVHRKGAASATFQMFWDFGFGAGSMGLGVVAANFGYRSIYIVSLVLVALIIVIYIAALSKFKEEKKQEA